MPFAATIKMSTTQQRGGECGSGAVHATRRFTPRDVAMTSAGYRPPRATTVHVATFTPTLTDPDEKTPILIIFDADPPLPAIADIFDCPPAVVPLYSPARRFFRFAFACFIAARLFTIS